MKRCPNCQRTYPDDAPGFCINDGVQLVNEQAQAFDPQKTILASAPPPPQYSNPVPPPANQPPPAPWPPPPQQQQQQQGQQQAQNWGGGYPQHPGQQQPYGSPYAPPAGKSNKLTLTTLILGGLSGLLGLLLLADYLGWAHILNRDTIYPVIIAAVVTGVAALLVGTAALISARQRSKAMAVIGMVLGAATIGFYIYLENEYPLFF
ncbi:MAG: DUF4190 domain-containing protein [Acidobacteria bacterium]|nr:DUF4190 domain-containing protein [Acidobacteriota bacterium]